MKLDQLTYFLHAARTEHIGKAAKAANISPSAISHSIALLEEELGRELFVKKGKNIFLTEHGKILRNRTEELLASLEKMREDLASNKAQFTGKMKLAASHDLVVPYFAKAVAQLQSKYPGIECEVLSMRSSQVIAGITSGELDAGVCFSPLKHPTLETEVLLEGNLIIALRKGHPLLMAKGEEFIKKLNALSAVMPKAFQGVDVCESHPILASHGIKPRPTLLFDRYALAVEQVKSSDSWAFFPDWVVRENKSYLVEHPLCKKWKSPFQISFVWSKERLQTQLIRELKDLTLKVMQA